MKNLLKRYVHERDGQFAIMFSVLSTMLITGVVVAVETTNLHNMHRRLNFIAEAAALAGSRMAHLSEADRQAVVAQYVKVNGDPYLDSILQGSPYIKFDDVNEEVTVALNAKIPLVIGKLIGRKDVDISGGSVTSYVQKTLDPVTIAFALDVSGSMGWTTTDGQVKIEALKDSIEALFLEVEAAVDEPGLLETFMRTGMSTYNTAMTNEKEMGWGWKDLHADAKTLVAGGGTNSVPALSNAYAQIKNDRILRTNHDPDFNQSLLRESVIFMTDGDNNQPNWDNESVDVCLDMRAEGINIFSVAFAAPDKGTVMLLDCASWDDPAQDLDSDKPNGNSNSMGCLKAADQAKNNNGKGPCKEVAGKEGHFFDADDAEAFKEAFRDIGRSIVHEDIRVKSGGSKTAQN